MNVPELRHLRVPDLEIAYYEMGDGPPVLLFHGFPDLATTFLPLSRNLEANGFRAIAPWLRGYWPSGNAGFYDIGSLVSDAIEFLDALKIESVHVIGHDWGADVAYGISAARPDLVASALVLAVPHGVALGPNRRRNYEQLRLSFYMWLFQVEGLAEEVISSDHFSFLGWLWREWSPAWDPPADHLSRVADTFAHPGVLEAALGYYRVAFGVGSADPAHVALREATESRIEVPTSLLLGQRDRCLLPELSRGAESAFGSEYQVEVIPDCGHFLHLERPDIVADRAMSWFSRFPSAYGAAKRLLSRDG